MISDISPSTNRFRLLATFIAGRSLEVTAAPAGRRAHTDGQVIFVTATRPSAEQRREVVVQSALLAAGSLPQQLTRTLQARPRLARRYLALEGHRALTELTTRLPLAATLRPQHRLVSASAAESLAIAKSRANVPDPPDWFGVITPARNSGRPLSPHSPRTENDLQLQFDRVEPDADDEEGPFGESKILKLFEAPAFTVGALSDFLRKLLGSSPSSSEDSAGAELQLSTVRRGRGSQPDARALPAPIRFDVVENCNATMNFGGVLYPEWDVHRHRYRPQWCRVIDFPLPTTEIGQPSVISDSILRQRLSRIGLGHKALRGRPDGDEVDTDALVELFIDLRSGYAPPEHVYIERAKLGRDLGVLILLDASGSATDIDADGRAVHEHQRRAAATLAATLEELGDRVAVYGFRSEGRRAVYLPAIKTFEHRFGAAERNRLAELQPSGYTRLGAGIRGAGEILKNQAGTPNRLLLVLSDGFPYDDGYEGRYAQADSAKALEELRRDGVACLCLSIGAGSDSGILDQVFGPAGHASAAELSDLSPVMDQLFMSALRELAAPAVRTPAGTAVQQMTTSHLT